MVLIKGVMIHKNEDSVRTYFGFNMFGIVSVQQEETILDTFFSN